MKFNSLSINWAFALIIASLFVSCSEDIMDKINVDKNHPQDVSARFIVTDLITSTAFNTVGGDLSLYSSVYMEHEAGIHNQLFNAETRNGEPYLATTFNNAWGGAYINLKNALTVIKKCQNGGNESANPVTLAVGQIFAAYNIAILTDAFGDVPWSEACQLENFKQPKIDKQSEIYADINQLLDDAILNLDKSDAIPMGQNDILYQGNSSKWKKAAYALKARYAMRTLNRASDKNAVLTQILTDIDQAFISSLDEMKFNHYDGSKNLNPYFAFNWSRDALAASQSLVDLFKERNDPRGNEAFMSPDWVQFSDPSKVNAAPNGLPNQEQYVYATSVMYGAESAPTMLLSYHELMFIKAEALCRLGRIAEGEIALKEAMSAAFDNFGNSVRSALNSKILSQYGGINGKTIVNSVTAETYFENKIKALYYVNPLKEVMTQKYLAFYGASGESVEAYNDYRRLQANGEHFIELKNPLNKTQFPLRMPYGADDVLANLHVKEAFGDGQYVFSENVWWAGGSR